MKNKTIFFAIICAVLLFSTTIHTVAIKINNN
jgi:hypothetical protein